MPYYYFLRNKIRQKKMRDRVIDNILALRDQLDRDIPVKDAENNFLLATWNIRDFGKVNRRGFGKRLPETHFYIAEVISRFDLVAVQEVNELNEWEIVMDILGPDWDYIATDVTDRSLGGNGERMTFVFDKRKVWFKHVTGEIVLPNHMLISRVKTEVKDKSIYAGKQFRRTPFIVSFQSGWLKFDICTVHIYFGEDYGKPLQERIEEIEKIAKYLSKRADKELKRDKALILLGDFNIVKPEHETMKALLNQGFSIPKALDRPTNIKHTKYYDQIAFKTKPQVIEYIDKDCSESDKCNAGVFNIFESIFTEKQFDDYKEAVKKSKNAKKIPDSELLEYYLDWRTYQFSDHEPMWVRLKTNESDNYLKQMKV